MNKFRVARRACTVRGDKTRGTVSFSLVTECGATAGWRRIAIGKGLRAKEDTHASSAANASRRTCDTRREQEREKKKSSLGTEGCCTAAEETLFGTTWRHIIVARVGRTGAKTWIE